MCLCCVFPPVLLYQPDTCITNTPFAVCMQSIKHNRCTFGGKKQSSLKINCERFNPGLPTLFCVGFYFSNDKLNEIYEEKEEEKRCLWEPTHVYLYKINLIIKCKKMLNFNITLKKHQGVSGKGPRAGTRTQEKQSATALCAMLPKTLSEVTAVTPFNCSSQSHKVLLQSVNL